MTVAVRPVPRRHRAESPGAERRASSACGSAGGRRCSTRRPLRFALASCSLSFSPAPTAPGRLRRSTSADLHLPAIQRERCGVSGPTCPRTSAAPAATFWDRPTFQNLGPFPSMSVIDNVLRRPYPPDALGRGERRALRRRGRGAEELLHRERQALEVLRLRLARDTAGHTGSRALATAFARRSSSPEPCPWNRGCRRSTSRLPA